MARSEKWDDVWEGVKVVAVVAIVAGGLIAVGVYLSRRRGATQNVGGPGLGAFPVPSPLVAGGLFAAGAGAYALAHRRAENDLGSDLAEFSAVPLPDLPPATLKGRIISQNMGFKNFIVKDRAVEIVHAVMLDGARAIRITTDQPIRVFDSAVVENLKNQGMFVTPGREFRFGPIGPDQRLFAVRAAATAANVTVVTEFVRA